MDNFQLLLHEPDDGVLVLSMSGELDLATVGPVREATKAATDSGDYRCLVFDLSQLDFMDSSGIQVLVDTNRRMKARGGHLRVVSNSPNIGKVLEITALDRVLDIVPDRETALALVA